MDFVKIPLEAIMICISVNFMLQEIRSDNCWGWYLLCLLSMDEMIQLKKQTQWLTPCIQLSSQRPTLQQEKSPGLLDRVTPWCCGPQQWSLLVIPTHLLKLLVFTDNENSLWSSSSSDHFFLIVIINSGQVIVYSPCPWCCCSWECRAPIMLRS